MTKVKPLLGRTGKPVANQYIIIEDEIRTYFQSYDSIISCVDFSYTPIKVELDAKFWNYSVTTSTYRNKFLGESTKETQAKINSGEYKLVDLNN